MSKSIEDHDIVTMFISESKEHLACIEDTILTLEQTKNLKDSEAINQLFRAVHTIKGGAGFLNLTSINVLTHKLETLFSLMRNGQLALTTHTYDTLLHCIDTLKVLINTADINSDRDISSQLASLDGILEQQQPKEPRIEGNTLLANDSEIPQNSLLKRIDLSNRIPSNSCISECTVDFTAEFKKNGLEPQQLIADLESIGTILHFEWNKGTLDAFTLDKQSELIYTFLLASPIDDREVLCEGLKITPLYIRCYSKKSISDLQEKRQQSELQSSQTNTINLSNSSHGTPKNSSQSTEVTQLHKSPLNSNMTLRIPLRLLDKAMNLASELVLVRNQNMQALAGNDINHLSDISQRLNVITSEIQETIMRTRMQPVGEIFNRFSRVVRDLAKKLKKEITLQVSGTEVELDKTILEALNDPLTHIIRNSLDHGFELPQERKNKGKDEIGVLQLTATQQAGYVLITIQDDGKGIDPARVKASAIEKGLLLKEQTQNYSEKEIINLIFEPGFSTAEQITDISGRGVGMNVVKDSIQKLGGTVEVDTFIGKGTTITLRLPLTLAIVPALIVSVEQICFALPQVNITEIVWLYGQNSYQKIEQINNREVYRLRGKLLPVIRLSELLHIQKTYTDPYTEHRAFDRRTQRTDRRNTPGTAPVTERRAHRKERRQSLSNSLYIVILRLGNEKFGLIIDAIVDTEEIVVKPLHDQLKNCQAYAGSTVLGDGRIAMVLDVTAIALLGKVQVNIANERTLQKKLTSSTEETYSTLLFTIGGDESYAVPLYLIMRVDLISADQIQTSGGRHYLQLRGEIVPIIRIESVLKSVSCKYEKQLYAIIPRCKRRICILASTISDIVEVQTTLDTATILQRCVIGAKIINNAITLFLDVFSLIEEVEPEWFVVECSDQKKKKNILLVEDMAFYQTLLGSYLKGMGFDIITACNGKEGIEALQKNHIDIIVSDINMPDMDGYQFAEWVRGQHQYKQLPMLALSAQNEELGMTQALAAGFDKFVSKQNREQLLGALLLLAESQVSVESRS